MGEEVRITRVGMQPEGIEIGYLYIPRDLRKNGLMWNRSVLVPVGSDYDDEIDAVTDALQALLDDVLDDEDRAEPVDLDEEDEEDDDDDE